MNKINFEKRMKKTLKSSFKNCLEAMLNVHESYLPAEEKQEQITKWNEKALFWLNKMDDSLFEKAEKLLMYTILGIYPAHHEGRELYNEFFDVKKIYRVQYNIGKVKYLVSYHDGIKKHKDMSDLYDVQLFNNKVKLEKFIKELENDDYKLA